MEQKTGEVISPRSHRYKASEGFLLAASLPMIDSLSQVSLTVSKTYFVQQRKTKHNMSDYNRFQIPALGEYKTIRVGGVQVR